MTRRPIPTGEAHESDFGAFQDAAAERPAPIKPEEVRSFVAEVHRLAGQERLTAQQREALQRAHEAAQVRRFAA